MFILLSLVDAECTFLVKANLTQAENLSNERSIVQEVIWKILFSENIGKFLGNVFAKISRLQSETPLKMRFPTDILGIFRHFHNKPIMHFMKDAS